MSRRNNKKHESTPAIICIDDSDNSDTDLTEFSAKTSRTTKSKRRNTCTMKPKKTISGGTEPNNSITLDDTTVRYYPKEIDDKIKAFFKSHNIVSGDVKNKIHIPQKNTKEFYMLSDSEDDFKVDDNLPYQSSTSHVDNEPETSSTPDNSFNLCEIENNVVVIPDSSNDEPTVDVDKILADIVSDNQRWAEYKNEMENLLHSTSTLYNEVSSDIDKQNAEFARRCNSNLPKQSCPVCFEILCGETEVMSTTCGHIFCKPCIDKVVQTLKRCPTCRQVVTQQKVHKIYL